MTNLIVFAPTLLLVQLFRRTKRRHTRISRIKQILKQSNLQNDSLIKAESQQQNEKIKGTKKKKTEFKFPWWCKIFAYVLSFSFATVSLFFVIVKGIEFGDEKVQKWLTSLIISFFSSLLLTQPLQVSYFFKQKSQ
jgi:polycystin 1L2